jgi:hypothetical protein
MRLRQTTSFQKEVAHYGFTQRSPSRCLWHPAFRFVLAIMTTQNHPGKMKIFVLLPYRQHAATRLLGLEPRGNLSQKGVYNRHVPEALEYSISCAQWPILVHISLHIVQDTRNLFCKQRFRICAKAAHTNRISPCTLCLPEGLSRFRWAFRFSPSFSCHSLQHTDLSRDNQSL